MNEGVTEGLTCPKCGKECKTNFGLTNHLKACKGGLSDGNGHDRYLTEDHLDDDPRYSKPKQKADPYALGAFMLLPDHIPMVLELNFAEALSEHILSNGSQNRAILAFGHQLRKASGVE